MKVTAQRQIIVKLKLDRSDVIRMLVKANMIPRFGKFWSAEIAQDPDENGGIIIAFKEDIAINDTKLK